MDKQFDQQQAAAGTMTKGTSTSNSGLTDEQKAWIQDKQRAQSTVTLPPGACHTVYYINQRGRRAHFTPGLPPRKKVLDGPNWGNERNERNDSDDEVEIPKDLE